MRKSSSPKIFLGMFFTLILFTTNLSYGMFNEQGQWICSKEIDIEVSYYKSYTDRFQNAINKVYSADGAKAAQSYFEFAIKEEITGQDWKRSHDCLTRLGIDITELSTIIIPREEIPPREDEYSEIESIDATPYAVVTTIIIIMIVGVVFFSFKSRKKYRKSENVSVNNEERDERHENVEIEIKGGIEKGN